MDHLLLVCSVLIVGISFEELVMETGTIFVSSSVLSNDISKCFRHEKLAGVTLEASLPCFYDLVFICVFIFFFIDQLD